MKIVLAPDSFKDSLTAPAVCEAMTKGIFSVLPEADILKIPLADGGEGTVRAMVAATGGTLKAVRVTGPLGEKIEAHYGLLGDGKTAVIEMAAASGLELVPQHKRNPRFTTTFGTGELICDALSCGADRIVIGIGGSATTDGGCGMAQALGVRFFDGPGKQMLEPMTGEMMGRVARIDLSGLNPRLSHAEIRVACDVGNPLLGPEGAARVFGPQKGASPADVESLEQNMAAVFDTIEPVTGRQVRMEPGAGAAGGLGAGLMAFLGAKLESGITLVLDILDFQESIKDADLILTGEGRVDFQTVFGKTVAGVAGAAKRQNIPVIVLAGSVGPDIDTLYKAGITSVFSICDRPMTLETAIQSASELIARTSERVLRIFKHTQKKIPEIF